MAMGLMVLKGQRKGKHIVVVIRGNVLHVSVHTSNLSGKKRAVKYGPEGWRNTQQPKPVQPVWDNWEPLRFVCEKLNLAVHISRKMRV